MSDVTHAMAVRERVEVVAELRNERSEHAEYEQASTEPTTRVLCLHDEHGPRLAN